MIATNIIKHPNISFISNTSSNIKAPPITANTDSKDINIESTVGLLEYFWPTICKVYAIPLENTPKNKIGNIICRFYIKYIPIPK